MKQESCVSLFKRLAEQQKLSHAYLFSGNDEEQKNALVQDIVTLLRVHTPDQMILEPAQGEITIGQIRGLSGFLSMTSWNSPYKIAVLRVAHTMNAEAQSAFLKLLEEPKGDCVFFLLSEYPDMLLPTIRSRVQEFPFYAFAATEVPAAGIREFEKLQKADIARRFAYAKKLADAPDRIAETLQQWLAASRYLLHAAVKENSQTAFQLASTIHVIQETSVLLRGTNVNPRLALERLMLHL